MTRRGSFRAGLAAVLAAALAACGGGGDDAGGRVGHSDTHIESSGRLAILDGTTTAVRVLDLDRRAVEGTFAAASVPSAIYASPDRRYALVFERLQDRVRFVDGGLWQEDHGDHLHDYREAPRLLDFALTGSRPTHYEAHDGDAAVFMDGQADAGRNAGVALLTDDDIGRGRVGATLALPVAMHGTAEPRGDFLLTTYRAPETSGTSPSHVELYRRSGAGYQFVQRFAEECPGLHGSFSNETHSAFGCTDGVLVVAHSGQQFTARKLPNPAGLTGTQRIGTITGHHDWTEFVGFASPGHAFRIDPAAGTITRIEWAADRTQRAYRVDDQGRHLLLLDDLGRLHLLERANAFRARTVLPAIVTMPAQAPYPSIAASGAAERAFVSDPVGRRIVTVDLRAATIGDPIPLDFSPTGLAWLGFGGHTHD